MKSITTTAFVESIWEQFNKPLKSFIKSRVKNDQDIDDILQDVFYKIHSNINSIREDDKVHAWVYRITRNSIIDFYRAYKNEKRLIELSDDISEIAYESSANDEILECLKAMIQNLPEKYKQAIILTEYQNLTQKELGERMGLSISGAKSRVQRARTKLKDMLLCCCHFEFDRLGNVIEYNHKCSDCKLY